MRQRVPVSEVSSSAKEPKRSLFQSAIDFLFGYDFFISYAWKDARSYAVALAEKLRTQGFECFLDSTEFAKGDDWRSTGKRALRKTSKLLLLGSPAALDSEPVLHELEAFQSTNRIILPIDFGESLRNPAGHSCPLLQKLSPNILSIAEPLERLGIGPSENAMKEIRDGFRITRQQQKRLRWFAGAATAFAVIAVVALWQWYEAENRKHEAEIAGAEAKRQKGEAERQKATAQKETGIAIEAERKAKEQASQSEYLRACDLTASGEEDRALLGFANALKLNSVNCGAATRLINLLGQRSWPRLIATLQHTNRVERLTATQDGRHLFVATGKPQGGGDEISAVYAWDLASLRLMTAPQVNLEDDAAPVWKLCVNATGDRVVAFRRLANPKWIRSIELFDVNSGRMIARWQDNNDESLDKFFLSSDGQFILYSLRGEQPVVKVISAKTGRLVNSVRLEKSDSDTGIVTADSIEGTIYILDDRGRLIVQALREGSSLRKYSLSSIQDAKAEEYAWAGISPDRRSILALFKSNAVSWYVGRWRLADGKSEQVWGGVTGSDLENVEDWDANFDAADGLTLVGPDYSIEGSLIVLKTTMSKDRSNGLYEGLVQYKLRQQPTLILGENSFLTADGKAARINSFEGGPISGVMRHDGVITAVCAIGNDTFATGTTEGEVKIWRLVSSALSLEKAPSKQTGPDSGAEKKESNLFEDEILDVTRDGSAMLRKQFHPVLTRMDNGKPVELHGPWENDDITWSDACFAPDTKSFAVVGHVHESTPGDYDFHVRIFSTADGSELAPPLSHTGCYHAIFGSQGKRLITVGEDEFRVWDFSTNPPHQEIRVQPGVEWAQAGQNGQIYVTLSENASGIVWDAKNLRPLRNIEPDSSWGFSRGPEPLDITIRPVLSEDCRRLAAALGEYIVVWDVDTGRPLTDPINCGDTVEFLTFPNGSSNELHAKLQDGAEVVWKPTDISEGLAQQDVVTLGNLVEYVTDFMPFGKIPLFDQQKNPNLGVLADHFRKVPQTSSDSPGENSKNSSSEAVAKFWLEVGLESWPPDPEGDLIQGLQQAASFSLQDKQAIEGLLEMWKRRACNKIELDLGKRTLRLPGKYEDAGPSERDAINYLKAALVFDPENPVLLSGLAFLSQLELEQESGEPAQASEQIEIEKKAIAAWTTQAENSLTKTLHSGLNDPVQAWDRAQALACLGKLDETLEISQTAGSLGETQRNHLITQAVLFFALGKIDAGSRTLDAAGSLSDSDGDRAKSLKARFLIAQKRNTDEAAQLSLSISDEHLDLPLWIWTCDWLASKGRLKEALDRLLKIHASPREQTGELAVKVRLATCFWSLRQASSAIPYFRDLMAQEDFEVPVADLPPVLIQAWQKGKMEIERQQNQSMQATQSAPEGRKSPVNLPSGEASAGDSDAQIADAYATLKQLESKANKIVQSIQSAPGGRKSPVSPSSGGPAVGNISAQIADADVALNRAYALLRSQLGKAERDVLKMEEVKWIKQKEGLPANSEELLKTIQERTQILQKRLEERERK